MKKIILLLLTSCFAMNAFSQITITENDIAQMNSVVATAYDTTFAGISVGSGGTNQTWDFSNLENHYVDTVRIVDPATTPYANYYPAANITNFQALGEIYTYGIKDANSYSTIGYLFYEQFFFNDTIPIIYSPAQTILTFPSTYNTQFNTNSVSSFEAAYAIQFFDSIRYTATTSTSSNIDGWGNTITPKNDTINTLRQTLTERTRELYEGHTLFGWITVPPFPGFVPDTTYTHITYKYIGNSRGSSIVEITTDSVSGNIIGANYLFVQDTLINTTPYAGDDYVNTPQNTQVLINVQLNDVDYEGGTLLNTIITNPSNGSAIEQNANILFTPNNGFSGTDTFTYQICDNGSPSLCDTAMVFITIIPPNQQPFAVDDTASIMANDSLNIFILNNDSDPDGDLIFGNVLSGPNNGTATLQFDLSIKYIPNTAFTGMDTFFYQLCDNGTPSLCDTAMVVVTVSPRTGIKEFMNDNSVIVQIFPNPFKDKAEILIQNPEFKIQTTEFRIFNVVGKEVYRQKLNTKHETLNTILPGGIYFYQLTDDEKSLSRGKIIITN